METKAQKGYLVLADISGFTSFVAATELEHAYDILGELLELIVERFSPLLKLVELEGDCVYARGDEATIPGGQVLLDIFDNTYMGFRDRVEAIRRHTTCQCNACRLIPTLDLKFLTHFGEYILQTAAGVQKPVGSAVNLVHRLAKNHVAELKGWRGYALFTADAVAHLAVDPAALFAMTETYEHLGEVRTHSLDMRERYRILSEARRVVVERANAHASLTVDMPAPPPVVWEWLNDPQKRSMWEGNQITAEREGEPRGPGARNHCLHGKNAAQIQTILDWRPFEYFTYESHGSASNREEVMITHSLQPVASGTRVTVAMRVLLPFPEVVRKVMGKMMVKQYHIEDQYRRLAEMLRPKDAPVSVAPGVA
jgi:hypothetical protein